MRDIAVHEYRRAVAPKLAAACFCVGVGSVVRLHRCVLKCQVGVYERSMTSVETSAGQCHHHRTLCAGVAVRGCFDSFVIVVGPSSGASSGVVNGEASGPCHRLNAAPIAAT